MCKMVFFYAMLIISIVNRVDEVGSLESNTSRSTSNPALDELSSYGNPSRRPQKDSTTVVQVSLHLTSVDSINDMDWEMTSTLFLLLQWRDPKLEKLVGDNESTVSIFGNDIDRVWKPDVYFVNSKRVYFDAIPSDGRTMKVHHGIGIIYIMRLRLTSICEMRLEKFPYDRQECEITLSSIGYTNEELTFKWFENTTGIPPLKAFQVDQKNISQFILYEQETREFILPKEVDVQEASYLTAILKLKRNWKPYAWSYFVQTGILVLISWVSFWIDIDAVPARIGLGTTTVLSYFTLMNSARNALPKVGYETLMDEWLNFHLYFVIAALLEYAIAHHFNYKHKLFQEKMSESVDKDPSADDNEYEKELFQLEPKTVPSTDNDSKPHQQGTFFSLRRVFFDVNILNNQKRHRRKMMKRTCNPYVGRYRRWALKIDSFSKLLFPVLYFVFLSSYLPYELKYDY